MSCHSDERRQSLRREYDTWKASAPSKPLAPKTRPTADQIQRLREHGSAYKDWLWSLSGEERQRIEHWGEEDAKRLKEEARVATLADASKRRKNDALQAGATSQSLLPPICRHWTRTGGICLYGVACKFHHPPELVRRGADLVHDALLKGPVNPHRSRTRKNRTNSNRMGAFRRFLLDEYGENRLKSGSGVVEVSAGIHGGISFELLNLNRVRCTAIEPRGPPRLEKKLRNLAKGIYHRTQPLQRYNSVGMDDLARNQKDNGDTSVNHEPNTIGTSPRIWPLFFGPWITATSREAEFDRRLLTSLKRAAALISSPTLPACGHEDDCNCSWCSNSDEENGSDDDATQEETRPDRHYGSDSSHNDNQQPPTASEVMSTIQSASILIGLHPDQPTGDIVDAALALSKPFAVCPCCVFWSQFPERSLPDGSPVKTYENLLDWIRAKDERIRTHQFDFGGRSTLLYFDPHWE